MKRSTRCDYALQAVLELSHYYNNKLVRLSDLANNQNVPQKYLEQIMVQLKKGGYVHSKKGPHGGYTLAKPPGEIYLGDIIRMIDTRMFTSPYSETLQDLENLQSAQKNFFGVWAEIQGAVFAVIDNISFEDILRRESQVLSRKNYNLIYHI